jgi:hypothetical protein
MTGWDMGIIDQHEARPPDEGSIGTLFNIGTKGGIPKTTFLASFLALNPYTRPTIGGRRDIKD